MKTETEELTKLIATLEKLTKDLRAIRNGEGPTPADLVDAPVLEGWTGVYRPVWALQGAVAEHPRLGSRPAIVTSEVYHLDTARGWARTFSRFYRLGCPGQVPDG